MSLICVHAAWRERDGAAITHQTINKHCAVNDIDRQTCLWIKNVQVGVLEWEQTLIEELELATLITNCLKSHCRVQSRNGVCGGKVGQAHVRAPNNLSGLSF
jgi:hypothetical protein